MQFACLLLVALCGAAPAEDLQCLKPEAGGPQPSELFYARLQQEAYKALDRRRGAYEELKTPEQATAYQSRLREFFVERLGGFPERTPLNAQVVGTLPGDGYRIEKIIFETQPKHHVTATLYLPSGVPPYPGVLVSSGHSRTGKAADYNQRFGIMLAKHGIAALCYDPIGQGERSQFLTAEGRPQFNSTTQEHFLIGVGSILLGTNTARYRAWDGMRAIDYLTSRGDIDPQRIGMTGCSGGGTLTSYVMALDDRVACAAPSCYLTTFRRLIETIGPQDAEQNIFGQVAFGLDQPDYILLRAPRPTLISSTTGDFFDIQGSWDNYRQAKRLYGKFGFPERVDLVESEGGHGVPATNLVAITRWMRRWLLGKDEAIPAEEITARPEADLLCTEKGQVLLLPGERSVNDLNVEWEQRLALKRREFWERTPTADALRAVRETIGVRTLDQIPPPKMIEAGRVEREGYHIDKLVLETDSGVPLPGLTFHPAEPRADAYLYLHEDGKLADAAPGGPIEKLVRDRYVVVAIDLRGTGETASGKSNEMLGDWKNYYLAYLLGRPLVGLQTEDALAAGNFVAYYKTKKPRRVHLVGVGRAGVPALHAAALAPELFASVTLRDTLESWSAVVTQPVPAGQLTSTVHGALRVYDLPDLVRSLDPAKVHIERGEP
jgi:dienelactone hydrolase